MFKYYLLPFIICAITISSSHNNNNNIFDTAGTYFLAVVALIFTLPHIGVVTRNEKSIVGYSIILLFILLLLGYYNTIGIKIFLWILLGLFGIINTINDIYQSRKKIKKIQDIISVPSGNDSYDLGLFETL